MRFKIIEQEVLSPLGKTDSTEVEVNPIPQRIESIALVDNTKPGADILLEKIKKNISASEFFTIKTPAGAPATEEQIKKAQADLVILALGDCGSCTTWLIFNAIKLEKQGIPSISVCSDIFASFGRVLAHSYGCRDLRIVEVEHPLAGQPKEIILDKAGTAVNQIKKLLK